MKEPPLTHDDYCRLVGRLVIDTFLRIEYLEKQNASLFESFHSQAENLRTELETARKYAALTKAEQGVSVELDGTSSLPTREDILRSLSESQTTR